MATFMDENLRRAQAEFELREARSELAQANQLTAMGSFATSIAHEINQPLATLVAHAEAGLRWLNRLSRSRRGDEEPPEHQPGRAARRRHHHRVARAGEAGPAPLTIVTIEDVVDEVLKIVCADLKTNGIQLSLALSTERHAILVNNIQLQQVLFNLITNAVQAMANAATPERHLRISTGHCRGQTWR